MSGTLSEWDNCYGKYNENTNFDPGIWDDRVGCRGKPCYAGSNLYSAKPAHSADAGYCQLERIRNTQSHHEPFERSLSKGYFFFHLAVLQVHQMKI